MPKNFLKNTTNVRSKEMLKKYHQVKLHSIPFKNEVIQQIGINIGSLPKVDGLKHLVVRMGYFSKWSETKPIKDKYASTISQFLYGVKFRHGYMKMQINDQGIEFDNEEWSFTQHDRY